MHLASCIVDSVTSREASPVASSTSALLSGSLTRRHFAQSGDEQLEMIAALTEQLESAEEELNKSRQDNQELLQAVTALEEEKVDSESAAEEMTAQLENMFEEMSTLNERLEKVTEEKELLQKEHWEQSKQLQPLLQIEKEYKKQNKLKEWLEIEKKEKATLAAELKHLRSTQAVESSVENERLLRQLETERQERATLIENMKREVIPLRLPGLCFSHCPLFA